MVLQEKKIKEHHVYRMSIIGGSGSEKQMHYLI